MPKRSLFINLSKKICISLCQNYCAVCKEALQHTVHALCEHCHSLCEPWQNQITTEHHAYEYGGPVQYLLREIKYRKRHEWIDLLPIVDTHHLKESMGGVHGLVPIVNPARTFHERGFDLPTCLAERCSKILGVPVWSHGIKRIHDTKLQASQSTLEARIHNVRGVFQGHPAMADKHVLLVDDIRTTGATLESARQALYKAGAAQVSLFALARVR